MREKGIVLLLIVMLLASTGSLVFAGGGKEAPAPAPAAAATVEKGPAYGGTMVGIRISDMHGRWNPIGLYAAEKSFIYEPLIWGDWYTPEEKWPSESGFWPSEYWAGALAESWEMPNDRTFVFKIRKGVHFQNKPPANGRELVAEDVKWNIETWVASPLTYHGDLEVIDRIECPDKYTMIVRTKEPRTFQFFNQFRTHPEQFMIVCPDIVKEKGLDAMVDWRNQLGTGPFMPKDIVEGSYWLFEKNPDYWQHDKLHPENRLPYVDQANMLSVPDESTRMALVRSGQMDFWTLGTETGGQVKWNFVEDLKKTNPQLQMRVGLGAPGIFAMHCKKKPYTDVRVRKAMNMAIDYPGIIKNYYQGNATQSYEMWPFLPSWGEWAIPESEFPDSVREQFTYNPEKAKQLLAEAGYPNGFKSNLDTYVPWLELSAVAVEYWRKIGIDCTITQRDLSVHWSILGPHSYPAIAVHTTSCGCLSRDPIENLEQWYKPGPGNLSEWEDQKYVDMLNAAAKIKDPHEQIKAYKKAAIYALEQAPYIMLPAQHYTSVWQPWLKGFWGQYGRYFSDMAGPGTHCWLDLDLKEQMTGKR